METKKVLLVDDDVDVINVLQAILEKEGYSVITASNKVEAMEKAKSEKPNLAILDVMMTTHYEGFELAQEFINSDDFKDMPILMETSIEVLTTTKPSVQAMAREFRKDPKYKELQVILVKDINSGNSGVDYRAENGETVWVPVSGFLRKPVDAKKLLPEVAKLLS